MQAHVPSLYIATVIDFSVQIMIPIAIIILLLIRSLTNEVASKSIEDSTPLIMTSKVFKVHMHVYSTIGCIIIFLTL